MAANASVQVTFAGQKRRVPLRPAVVPARGATPSPAWSMRASSGALPFVDRDGLLTRLKAWMADSKSFSTYLVGGRGGSGKTRLGVHLCSLAHEQDWVCGLLEARAEQAGIEALADVPTARLVVVDYAETRADQLATLLPILEAGASVEHPVRVLLLVRSGARDGDWCAGLRGHGDPLDAVLDATEQQVLDNCLLTVDERLELFTIAADVFAQTAQPNLVPGATSSAPSALEDPVFATTLMVVVAAYLAVHGAADLPTTRRGLLAGLADHEERHWRFVSDQGNLGLDQVERARIVALATLAGADDEQEAADLLRLLPALKDATAERRDLLARWASELYPGPRFWNPVEPDLLGEHLVTTHLSKYPGVLAGALQRRTPAALTQPLGLYARAVGDDPALTTVLSPALSGALTDLSRAATAQAASYPDLASLLGATTVATALQRAVDVIPVEFTDLAAAADDLPPRADLVLGPLALALTQRVATALRDLAATEPAVYEPPLATSLSNLANRLGDAGRYTEALRAIEEAVSIRRRLAVANPAGHELDLAAELGNYSGCLSDLGRHAEALSAIEEAVTIGRRLAEVNPDRYEPELATSLHNLSNRLSDFGRHTEALSAIEEAVTIGRRLAEVNPDRYEPELAAVLGILSVCLSNLKRHPEALGPIEEAVTIHRRLAAAEPAAYQLELTTSLNNLSNHLSDLGRHAEALGPIEEAVTIRRRLAEVEPATYEPHLAPALNNLSNHLSDLGQHAEALSAIEEAAVIYRRLAKVEPATYVPRLVITSVNLSNRLSQDGRHPEALRTAEQAVAIYRRLAEANPDTYEADLATALYNLFAHRRQAEQHAEALSAIEEAVTIRRRLAAVEPAAHESGLAMALNNLSNHLSDLEQHAEALSAIEETVTIRRRLVAANPAERPHLASALQNLSNRLNQAGRHLEAQKALQEADELRDSD